MPPQTAVEAAQQLAALYLSVDPPRPQRELIIRPIIKAHLDKAIDCAIKRRLELVESDTYNDSHDGLDWVIIQLIHGYIEHGGRAMGACGFNEPGPSAWARELNVQSHSSASTTLCIDVNDSRWWLDKRLHISEHEKPGEFLWVAVAPRIGNNPPSHWAPLGKYEFIADPPPEAVAIRRASQADLPPPPGSSRPGPVTGTNSSIQSNPASQPDLSTHSSPLTPLSPASRRPSQAGLSTRPGPFSNHDLPAIDARRVSQSVPAPRFAPMPQNNPATPHNSFPQSQPLTQSTPLAPPGSEYRPVFPPQSALPTQHAPDTQLGATSQFGSGIQPGTSTPSSSSTEADTQHDPSQPGLNQGQPPQQGPDQLDPDQDDIDDFMSQPLSSESREVFRRLGRGGFGGFC